MTAHRVYVYNVPIPQNHTNLYLVAGIRIHATRVRIHKQHSQKYYEYCVFLDDIIRVAKTRAS